MKFSLFVIAIMIILVFGYWEYQAVKKFYPDMKPWEFFFLQDRVIITPQGSK